MQKSLQNFIDLFSNNDSIVRNALKEKQKWILKTFFTFIDFSSVEKNGKKEYPSIYALMDQALHFELDQKNGFAYRIFTLKENIKLKEHSFYVGYDFTKMNHAMYCDFFANFYPCIGKEDAGYFVEEPLKALANRMIGDKKEYVLILPAEKTFDGNVFFPFSCQIIAKKSFLTEEEIQTICLLAEKLTIEIEWRM